MLPAGRGGGLGPGTVSVTPDPGLLEADPAMMAAAASRFQTAAHQVYSVATATSGAAGRLAAGWTGKGVEGFKNAASDTNWYSSSCADGLIGATLALSALSRSIAAAQSMARAAMALAGQTTDASAALDSAHATSQAHAVAALPASATSAQIAQAMAPTPSQEAHAQLLASDAARAVALMEQANTAARDAWRAAASTFDAVTSQSPSVQLAAISVRVKDFGNAMDSAAVDFMLLAAAGAVTAVPGEAGEEEEASPEFLTEEGADPAFAADLSGEEKMTVDGSSMDPAIAADLEGGVAIGWSDNVTVMQSFEDAALDPATADLVSGADPFGGMSPAEYQSEFWDPTAPTAYGKGSWIYPADDGADLSAPVAPKSFAPGDTFDRFGPESGNFASPEGTPWSERSLPATSLIGTGGTSTYHVYEVTDKWAADPPPVEVTQSKVAPAFGQPGGGVQYQFEPAAGSKVDVSVGWLLRNGYITEVAP